MASSATAPKPACSVRCRAPSAALQALLTLKILLELPGQLDGELLLLDFMNFSSLETQSAAPAGLRAPGLRADPGARAHEDRTSRYAALARGGRERHFDAHRCPHRRRVCGAADAGAPHSHAGPARRSAVARVRTAEYLLVCASGKRSLATARELRKHGLHARSLAGGLQALDRG